jgi:prepilin-type N-terminal cleavage/methylation domain-containing protein
MAYLLSYLILYLIRGVTHLARLRTLQEEREQGFTLIELLVVILIIGVLSTIAIPAFLNQRKSAVDATVQSDVRSIVTQVETLLTKMPASRYVISNQAGNVVIVRIRKTATDTTGEMTATVIVSDNNQTAMPVQYPQTPGTGCIVRATNTGGDRADRVVGVAAGYEYWSAGGGMQK